MTIDEILESVPCELRGFDPTGLYVDKRAYETVCAMLRKAVEQRDVYAKPYTDDCSELNAALLAIARGESESP